MAKKDKADKDRGEKKKGKKKEPPASGVLSGTVTQVARALRTRLSHGLAESGLYPGQDGVVQLLAQDDGQTPGALAHQLGVKAPTMTRTIGRMEAQGFVMRRTDDRDGRLTKVYLTDEGRGSVARIAQATAACEAHALQGLSGKDVKILVKLLAWNDLVAIGLMNGIARAGLIPGQDISVTGYDDLEEASIATPSLTTVWNGQAEVGRLAARALLDKLAGSHEPDGIHLIKPEMRIRQSTGPIRR